MSVAMSRPDRGSVTVAADLCKGCGLCVEACPTSLLVATGNLNRLGYHAVEYKGSGCTGCGICFYVCPEPGAITVLLRVPPQRTRTRPGRAA